MRSIIDSLTNRYLPIFFVGVLLYFAAISLRLAIAGGDPSILILPGEKFCNVDEIPENLIVKPEYGIGYDGQFYYRLSLNPFTNKETEYGITFDFPVYRSQRVLLSFITWIVTFGNHDLVVYALPMVNFLMVILLIYFCVQICRYFQWGAYEALLLFLYPGYLLILARTLTGVTSAAFVAGGIFFLLNKRYWLSGICLSLSVLARETTLILPFGMFVTLIAHFSYQLIANENHSKSKIELFMRYLKMMPATVLPGLTYIIWQVILYWNWQGLPVTEPTKALGLPFVGFSQAVMKFVNNPNISWSYLIRHVLNISMILGVGFLLLHVFFKNLNLKSLKEEKEFGLSFLLTLPLLLYGMFSTFLAFGVWEEDWAFLRSQNEFYLLGMLVLIHQKHPLRWLVGSAAILIWLLWGFYEPF